MKIDDLDNVLDDINDVLSKLPDDEFDNGLYKGNLRIQVTYVGEDGCECRGFQHHPNCPNHVMAF